jgi:NAD(P)-dependent dehydrogenase (short-subunit alcohol dehydrogenase family)
MGQRESRAHHGAWSGLGAHFARVFVAEGTEVVIGAAGSNRRLMPVDALDDVSLLLASDLQRPVISMMWRQFPAPALNEHLHVD